MRCESARRGVFRWRGWRGRHRRDRSPVDWASHALGYVERRLGLRDDQREAWDAFAAIVRDGGEAYSASDSGTSDALARLEAKADAALAIIRRVRPAFDRLQATLDLEQRERLNALLLGVR